jgi:hypothetical protein
VISKSGDFYQKRRSPAGDRPKPVKNFVLERPKIHLQLPLLNLGLKVYAILKRFKIKILNVPIIHDLSQEKECYQEIQGLIEYSY